MLAETRPSWSGLRGCRRLPAATAVVAGRGLSDVVSTWICLYTGAMPQGRPTTAEAEAAPWSLRGVGLLSRETSWKRRGWGQLDWREKERERERESRASSLAVRSRAVRGARAAKRTSAGYPALSWRRRPSASAPSAPQLRQGAVGRPLRTRARLWRATHCRRRFASPARAIIVAVRQLAVQKLVAERRHGGEGSEIGWEDEIVVPELDAPCHCGGEPRRHPENEPGDAKTVGKELQDVA